MSATEQDIKTNVTGTPYRILVFDANGLPVGYADFVRKANGNVGIGAESLTVPAYLTLGSNSGVYNFINFGENGINARIFRGSDGNGARFEFMNGANLDILLNSDRGLLQYSNSYNSACFRYNVQVGIMQSHDNLLTRLYVKGVGSSLATYAAKFLNDGDQILLSIRNDGNIGVGTDTPTSRLDLVGNTASLNQFRLRKGVSFTGTHLSGDVLHDIDKTFKVVTGRGVKESVLTILWKQFVNKTSSIANVLTSLLSVSSIQIDGNRTISLGHYQLGKVFDFNVIGAYTTSEDPMTAIFEVYIGATKIRTITLPPLGIVTNLRWELNFKTIQTTATNKKTLGTLTINTDQTNFIRIALAENSTAGFPTGDFDLKAVCDLPTASFFPSVNYATLKIE